MCKHANLFDKLLATCRQTYLIQHNSWPLNKYLQELRSVIISAKSNTSGIFPLFLFRYEQSRTTVEKMLSVLKHSVLTILSSGSYNRYLLTVNISNLINHQGRCPIPQPFFSLRSYLTEIIIIIIIIIIIQHCFGLTFIWKSTQWIADSS
jgi:hypothetical protein